jgi:hypothetical protein
MRPQGGPEVRACWASAVSRCRRRGSVGGVTDRPTALAQPVAIPPPGFDDLTVEERIDYVQSLWERIVESPDQLPVPDWHREVLDERLKDFELEP